MPLWREASELATTHLGDDLRWRPLTVYEAVARPIRRRRTSISALISQRHSGTTSLLPHLITSRGEERAMASMLSQRTEPRKTHCGRGGDACFSALYRYLLTSPTLQSASSVAAAPSRPPPLALHTRRSAAPSSSKNSSPLLDLHRIDNARRHLRMDVPAPRRLGSS